MSLIIVANFKAFEFDSILIIVLGIFLFFIVVIFLYYKKIIKGRYILILLSALFILGIISRLYYIFSLSFELGSDYALYYSTAEQIMNEEIIQSAGYIAYVGYVYIFSTILSFVGSIFGLSVKSILMFNLLSQIFSVFVLYKILRFYVNKIESIGLSILWFLSPLTLFAGLLVSTETFFILLFFILLYLLKYITRKYTLNEKKKILLLIAFGILISFTNNIRPIMLIFIIALIIYFLLSIKEIKNIWFLPLILISFVGTNFIFSKYVESKIGIEEKSGAFGWSVYLGSNNESCGYWTEKDSTFIFSTLEGLGDIENADNVLIKESIKRSKSVGLRETVKLIKCKFNTLWSSTNGTFMQVKSFAVGETLSVTEKEQKMIGDSSRLIFLFISLMALFGCIYEILHKKSTALFYQLFIVGYVIANLLIGINLRYILPMVGLLVLCSVSFIRKIGWKIRFTK